MGVLTWHLSGHDNGTQLLGTRMSTKYTREYGEKAYRWTLYKTAEEES